MKPKQPYSDYMNPHFDLELCTTLCLIMIHWSPYDVWHSNHVAIHTELNCTRDTSGHWHWHWLHKVEQYIRHCLDKIQTRMHVYTHTRSNIHTHTHTQTHIHLKHTLKHNTHTHMHAHSNLHTHTHTHTHTQSQTHACVCVHICTHTQ